MDDLVIYFNISSVDFFPDSNCASRFNPYLYFNNCDKPEINMGINGRFKFIRSCKCRIAIYRDS